MKMSFLVLSLVLSPYAMASVQCEKKLEAHFKKLDIKTSEMREENDYMKPMTIAEENKIMETIKKMVISTSPDEVNEMMKELDKSKVLDSRKNEIIRVCTSIKTFVELGIPEKDIAVKTLSYQNGWSQGMREPLDEVIRSEIEDYKNVSPRTVIKGINMESYFCSPNKEETECKTADGRVYKLGVAHKEEASLAVDDSNRSFFKKISDIFSFKREGAPAPVEDRSFTISK